MTTKYTDPLVAAACPWLGTLRLKELQALLEVLANTRLFDIGQGGGRCSLLEEEFGHRCFQCMFPKGKDFYTVSNLLVLPIKKCAAQGINLSRAEDAKSDNAFKAALAGDAIKGAAFMDFWLSSQPI